LRLTSAAALYLIGLAMEEALGRRGRLVARLYYAALLSLPLLNNLGLVDITLLYNWL
jgi:hypothetical protein